MEHSIFPIIRQLCKAQKEEYGKREHKTVGIADFKNNEHVLDYVDNDFVIINSLEEVLTTVMTQ